MFVGITLFYKLKFDFEINLVDFFVFLLDFSSSFNTVSPIFPI